MLTSPTNGSGFAEDGHADDQRNHGAGCKTDHYGGRQTACKRKNAWGSWDSTWRRNEFAYEVNIGSGYYKKEVEITVSDAVGNKETARNSVYNDGMGNIKDLDIALSADTTETTQKQWISYTNKNLFLKDADGVEVALRLCAVTENDQKIILNDLDTVDLEVHAVSGTAAIEGNKLTVSKDGHGFVQGRWNLADGAAMTASFTYGAEVLGQIEEEKGLQVIYPCKRRKRLR